MPRRRKALPVAARAAAETPNAATMPTRRRRARSARAMRCGKPRRCRRRSAVPAAPMAAPGTAVRERGRDHPETALVTQSRRSRRSLPMRRSRRSRQRREAKMRRRAGKSARSPSRRCRLSFSRSCRKLTSCSMASGSTPMARSSEPSTNSRTKSTPPPRSSPAPPRKNSRPGCGRSSSAMARMRRPRSQRTTSLDWPPPSQRSWAWTPTSSSS
mmetsp:Transcript_125391/g.362772  ORF Transcript_125391/g.362772 Transcript_125391/m.362772 type:complete len:214 (-) Transcript_125391:1593-2234(-)